MSTTPPKRGTRFAGAILLALCLVISACGSGSDGAEGDDTTTTDPGPVQTGGSLSYGLSAETDQWNPSAGRWAPSGLIVANAIFDTLTRWDEDGQIQPYLAESLEPNEDFTEWTITVRPDITFHNGEPLDAEALRRNLENHIDSPLTGPIFQDIEGVEVVDDRSVKVTYPTPFWNLPYSLSTQIGVVVAPEMLDNEDGGRQPIGTGPFVFDEWVPDNRLVVRRNADYWQTDEEGNQLPYLDQITFVPLPDEESRADSLLSGEIDAAQMTNLPDIAEFEANPDFQVFSDDTSEMDESFIMLNGGTEPFDDPVAREILVLATDPEAYNQLQNDGLAEVAEGPYRETSPWYHDVDWPGYDPEAAAALLEEYETENGPLTFEITSVNDATSLQGVQLLQQQWEDVGIETQIKTVEQAQLIGNVVLGGYQAVLWAQFGSANPLLETPWWSCDFNAPVPEFSLNFARNCDEELTEALDASRIDSDPANQKGYYDTVQERLAESMPYVWLTHQEVSIVARPEVISVFSYTLPTGQPGLPLNNGAHPLQQVWLKQS